MTEKLRFVRLGTIFSVHFERVSLLHMPTHYPGPVHCNTNSVGSLVLSVDNGRYRGSINSPSVFSAFWAGHCAVHAYSPVVLLCSVLTSSTTPP